MNRENHQSSGDKSLQSGKVDLRGAALNTDQFQEKNQLNLFIADYLEKSLQKLFPDQLFGSIAVKPARVQGLAGSVFIVTDEQNSSHIVKLRPFGKEVPDYQENLSEHPYYTEKILLTQLGKMKHPLIPVAAFEGLAVSGLEEFPAGIHHCNWWNGLATNKISTPFAVMLEGFVEGECQSESLYDQQKQCSILEELGKCAKEINKIRPSRIDSGKTIRSYKDQLPGPEQFIRQFEKLALLEFLNESEISRLKICSSPLWDCPAIDTLAHADLNPDNILSRGKNRISAILDWETALVAPAALEITRVIDRIEITGYRGITSTEQSERLEAFITGYKLTTAELKVMQPLIDAIEIAQGVRFLSAWYGFGFGEYVPDAYLDTDQSRFTVPGKDRVQTRWELVAGQFERRIRELLN